MSVESSAVVKMMLSTVLLLVSNGLLELLLRIMVCSEYTSWRTGWVL